MDRDSNQQENKEQPAAKPRLCRLNNLKKSQVPDTFSTPDHIYFINGSLRVLEMAGLVVPMTPGTTQEFLKDVETLPSSALYAKYQEHALEATAEIKEKLWGVSD